MSECFNLNMFHFLYIQLGSDVLVLRVFLSCFTFFIFFVCRLSEEPQWFIGEEALVRYTVDSGAGLYLDTWDWIALYKVTSTEVKH